jgi:hypothetical protein
MEPVRSVKAEAAARHRVLTREQTIVRIHGELAAARHRLGDEVAAESARRGRCDWRREEDPNMRAVAGSFDRMRDLETTARRSERAHVIHPGALVEVDGKERNVSSASIA